MRDVDDIAVDVFGAVLRSIVVLAALTLTLAVSGATWGVAMRIFSDGCGQIINHDAYAWAQVAQSAMMWGCFVFAIAFGITSFVAKWQGVLLAISAVLGPPFGIIALINIAYRVPLVARDLQGVSPFEAAGLCVLGCVTLLWSIRFARRRNRSRF